jgi:hypothetical protein
MGPWRLQTGICAVLFGTHFPEEPEALLKFSRSEEWRKNQLKIVFLSPPDSSDTLVLPDDIANDSTSASERGTAFTQGHRYVSLSRLEKGPKNTSELI